ncbi:MAG: hypothetical protein ACD_61C00053G0007 [uncultured bacterium]|nr:MAG: hypothetical protein ACD_61C00053G0007 [uncultured bacterium]
MAGLLERLGAVYGSRDEEKPESSSWITKRKGNNPYDQLRRTLRPDGQLSPKRTQDLIEEQEMLSATKSFIFEQVEAYIQVTFGPKDIDLKMEKFQKSWEKLFDKHGIKMIQALIELTDDIKFVNHNGEIRKVVLNRKLDEMNKRERGQ